MNIRIFRLAASYPPSTIQCIHPACRWWLGSFNMVAVVMSPTPFLPRISSSTPSRPNSGRVSLSFTCALFRTTTTGVVGLVRAADNSNGDDPPFLSEDDLTYLGKLGAGSVVGAAAIKYGSAIFPEITRPDITEALLIISFPVVVAVLLLLRQSLSSER